MVSSITLGNFFTQNGRTVLGGVGGSGLDTESLINGLVEAKRIPAKNLEDKITINDKRSAALGELKSLLSKLKDTTSFLRNPQGVANAADNAFKYTSATLASNTSIPASSYLSVTSAAGASTQSYTINEISSIAKAKKQASDNFAIASPDTSVVDVTASANRFGTGTFVVNGKTITLATGDSLNTVVGKFNAVSDDTGITANIVQVSSGQYSITFSATATGLDADFDLESAGTVTSDPSGVLSGIAFGTTQIASNAVFKIDAVEITRQSNAISDVISGLTFNLIAKTTTAVDPTELSVDIAPDTSAAKNGIINFVNAYNDLRIFFANQTKLNDDGTYSEDAVLAQDSTFRSILNKASASVGTIVSGIASGSNKLSDLGITFTDVPESTENPLIRNILNVDEAKLTSALATNYNATRKVFEFTSSSDNTNLVVYSHTNALTVSNFTLSINTGTSTYEANYLDSGGAPQTATLQGTLFGDGTGYTLAGASGTPFDGLVLLYASTSNATINVTATRGIADQLFADLDAALDETTGALTFDAQGVTDASARYSKASKRLMRNL